MSNTRRTPTPTNAEKYAFLDVVRGGNVSKVRDMLNSNGRLLNIITQDGWAPLFIAVYYGHDRIVKLLLDSGADINKADNDGWTPLYFAAQNGYVEIVQLLLEAGADINKAKNNGIMTPLFAAVYYGHDRIVKLIQERILFRAAMDTASMAEARGMIQDVAFEVFKKTVKESMKAAGDSDFDVDNSQIHSKLYNYFQGIMKSRHNKRSKTLKRTRTRFGKGKGKSKSKKPQKRPSSAVCTRAQKLGIRLTLKRNNKRVYKSEEMLRAQIKNAVIKRNKRKQTKK
jgi:ankyrin repeat protein